MDWTNTDTMKLNDYLLKDLSLYDRFLTISETEIEPEKEMKKLCKKFKTTLKVFNEIDLDKVNWKEIYKNI